MQSPLIDIHRKLGATLGQFAGVLTALDFGNPIEEHLATRHSVAVFDVSHMGRILVEGPDAPRLLNYLTPREIAKSRDGFMFGPNAFLNERAGFKDDVMLYRINTERWLIVCNAINQDKVLHWLEYNAEQLSMKNVTIEDLTPQTAMIAVQGPQSSNALKLLGLELSSLTKLQFVTDIQYKGGTLSIVSRSGWTGEDGFEIIGDVNAVSKLFLDLIKEAHVKPAGLIARDTLRIEMGFCLYGNEITEDITPIEARYWVFDLDKKSEYIGRTALLNKLRNGVDMVRLGVRMKKDVKFVPRKGYKIYIPGSDIGVGYVTSGAYSPVLQRPIAIAYISSRYAIIGLDVEIDIRGKRYRGKLVDFPFI